jgi:cytochrome P450
MQQMMVVYTNDLLQSLEAKKGQWLPSLETFGSFTLSQIIMLAFGGLISVEWMVKKQMELGHVFVSYLSGLIVYGPIYKYLPLPSVRNMFSIRKDVAEQTKSVIQQVREEVTRKIAAGEDHIIATNLLTTMITAKDASGRSFSDQDIIDEATTMLFAGFDTTAVTLSWALHYISRDKERQEKLRKYVPLLRQRHHLN